jgi:hypothetical protein
MHVLAAGRIVKSGGPELALELEEHGYGALERSERMSVMPTRKAEDWRYADLAALERLWPLAEPEAITVAAGGSLRAR